MKLLQQIAGKERLQNPQAAAQGAAESGRGDLRHAINALQFQAVGVEKAPATVTVVICLTMVDTIIFVCRFQVANQRKRQRRKPERRRWERRQTLGAATTLL